MMEKTVKIGSLFDGSGGFPLAASLCGVEPIWASEIEPYPIAVTRSRFPKMKHLGDVSKISGADIEPVDIVTFGSPCQDMSIAGKRAGLKHEDNGDDETTRSGLFMEAVRIIKEMREATNGEYPTFAVWENVPGAFSSNKGEDFRTVLEELIKIIEPTAVMPPVPENGWPYADSYCGDGWSLAYRVFDAQYWGVPQRRRRIYLVVDFGGGRAREILFEREGVRGYFETSRTSWQGAAGDAESCAGADDCDGGCVEGGCGLDAVTIEPGIAAREGGHIYEGVSGTLRAEAGDNRMAVAYTLKIRSGCEGGGKGALIQEDMSATLATNNDQYLFQPIPIHDKATRYKGGGLTRNGDGAGNGLGVGKLGDPVPTLSTCDHHMVCYANTYQKTTGPLMANSHPGSYTGQDAFSDMLVAGIDCRNGRLNGDLCGTLQAKPNGGFSYNCIHPVIIACHLRYIVRRLTPTECARLQGFPDKWGHPDHKDDFTDEEYRFWLDVRNTYAAVNGKPKKDYTKAQMLSWYNKLHTDSAEYKMWGNGIALPCALYCMQGIADAIRQR